MIKGTNSRLASGAAPKRNSDSSKSTMSGRERVKRCVEFNYPDRVPRHTWMLPGAYLGDHHRRPAVEAFRQRWPDDICDAVVPQHLAPRGKLVQGDPYEVGQARDSWGCVFENVHAGVHGQVKNPILADWSRLSDLHVPDELLTINFDSINRFCQSTDQFVIGGSLPRPFERLQFLRGSENVYMDLAEESTELMELLKIVHGYYLREADVWSKTDVDGLWMMDDWGSQRGLLISPAQWRRIFKPLYADYVRIAHDAGKKAFMHSDGFIFDIYQDLIEVGVDAINSQLFCMDIEEIGRRFGGRITFWGEFDRQYLLPYGSAEEVHAGMRRLEQHIFRHEGGAIAQFELGPGAKLENAEIVYQCWGALLPAK